MQPDPTAWARFLDFDGTPTGIASTPEAVVAPWGRLTIPSACVVALDGVVAIGSGRPLTQRKKRRRTLAEGARLDEATARHESFLERPWTVR